MLDAAQEIDCEKKEEAVTISRQSTIQPLNDGCSVASQLAPHEWEDVLGYQHWQECFLPKLQLRSVQELQPLFGREGCLR